MEFSKRDGYLELIDRCKNEKIDGVVVYCLSRIGRKMKDVIDIMELFNKNDIKFYSVKENINNVDSYDSFKKIKQIEIKDYNFIEDETKNTVRGVIAQQLKKIIPSAVKISKKHGYDDFHRVDSKSLVSHLISAFQYLSKVVEEQGKEIDNLKKNNI